MMRRAPSNWTTQGNWLGDVVRPNGPLQVSLKVWLISRAPIEQ
jgi:hypothetical protein